MDRKSGSRGSKAVIDYMMLVEIAVSLHVEAGG